MIIKERKRRKKKAVEKHFDVVCCTHEKCKMLQQSIFLLLIKPMTIKTKYKQEKKDVNGDRFQCGLVNAHNSVRLLFCFREHNSQSGSIDIRIVCVNGFESIVHPYAFHHFDCVCVLFSSKSQHLFGKMQIFIGIRIA